jgi:toxin ParE1/3/4
MTTKEIILRARAVSDIEEAVDHYVRTAGEAVTLGFINSLEKAYKAIASYPAAGSPRYAYELNLVGLRTWLLQRYPYIIFYMEHNAHIDVWRVLHAQRDIPAWMQEDT